MKALAPPGEGHPGKQGVCVQPSAEAGPWGATIFSPSFLVSPGGRISIFLEEHCAYKQSPQVLAKRAFVLCAHSLAFFTLQTQGDSLYCSKSALGSLRGGWYFRHSTAKEKLLLPATIHSSFTNQFFFFNSQDKLSFNGTGKKNIIFTHIIPRNSVFKKNQFFFV